MTLVEPTGNDEIMRVAVPRPRTGMGLLRRNRLSANGSGEGVDYTRTMRAAEAVFKGIVRAVRHSSRAR